MSNNRLSPEQLPDQITQHITEEQREDIKSFRQELKRLILPLTTNDLAREINRHIELYQDLQADGLELSNEELEVALLNKSNTLPDIMVNRVVQEVANLCLDFKNKLDLPFCSDVRIDPLRTAFFDILDWGIYRGLSRDTYRDLAIVAREVWPGTRKTQWIIITD